MPFCVKCGAELAENTAFCPKCGTTIASAPSSTVEKEKAYFNGEGEITVLRTKHKGLGAKAASWAFFGSNRLFGLRQRQKEQVKSQGKTGGHE